MNSQHEHSEPPLLAVWLLLLFTPAEQTESILGDLLEEFSALVTTSGLGFARRWYWRQAVTTIRHASASAFRAAPLLMFVVVLGGLWSIGFATRVSQHAMHTFLNAEGIYRSDPNAYLFWWKFPLQIGRVVICALVGVIVALAAKRREMQAVTAVSLAQMAMFFVAIVAVIVRGEEWFHWLLVMFKWNSLCAIGSIFGGLIVKLCRSSTAKGRSPA